MKTLKRDLRNGRVAVRVEVPDDLWYLSDLIFEGDMVISSTKRRIEKETGKKRSDRGEKVAMTIGVRVDTVEFDRNVDRLRIGGKIEQAPADVPKGDYHTLNIKPGSTLTIVKEKWGRDSLVKLQDAEKTVKAKVILIAIEEGLCSIGQLSNYGVRPIGTIRESIAGKKEVAAKEAETLKFFGEAASALAEHLEGLDRIIVAGPGFVKDSFYNYLKEKKPEVAKKAVVESVSMAGEKGLQEIVKRGIIEKVVKEAKITVEVREIQRLMEEISKDSGLATYGFAQVENAAQAGAVETLLVTNKLIRKYKIDKNERLEELMNTVENTGGKIVIVSEEHELGKQLEGLGGIGAVLRYRL